MNGTDFSRVYAEKLNISYIDAKLICDTLFDTMKEILFDKKENLVIRGLGTFKQVQRNAKRIVTPDGEPIIIPPKEVVKFVQSPTL